MGWAMVGIGAFEICASTFEWGWFMNNPTALCLEQLLGRTGARAFYGLTGAALVVVGLLIATGFIQDASEIW